MNAAMLDAMYTEEPPPELGEFLKVCRARLSPRTVGLPESGAPRRVPGLRREEVAQLVGIGPRAYARLEQGVPRHRDRYSPRSPGSCTSTTISSPTCSTVQRQACGQTVLPCRERTAAGRPRTGRGPCAGGRRPR
nr:helix-turn-helix transcriptional regulator [Streptomyces sp. MBT97]